MSKFKHHTAFAKPKPTQAFRFPFVCFNCRKSFKFPAGGAARVCPQCRSPMEMLSRKFAAPRSNDVAQWRKVQFLVERGFRFHSVFETVGSGPKRAVRYPETLAEAKEFAATYGAQAGRT